jgi:phosphoketolase
MIANGRRIDQRTTMSQQGGIAWFVKHLRLNNFDPIVFDGRDPAAFAWAIWEMERRLERAAAAVEQGTARYPVPLPHGIAVAPKGYGFHGAGTNLAHNLPLGGNPRTDAGAARRFNRSARRLWVEPDELASVPSLLGQHERSGRPREAETPIATRRVDLTHLPEPPLRPVPERRADLAAGTPTSGMDAIDEGFLAIVQANPHLRPRVGNPDEMRSNRMQRTLDALKFRVTAPEPGIPEAVDGAVVTALNEEAVACAALANKGGINIVVTYEAFGAKMYGAFRQEIVWADHSAEAGRPPGWLSIPLVLTSHTWENAKNERSHQDPAMAEAMLGEPSHVSRVLFVPDHNSGALVIREVYRTHGQLWTLVVPKGPVPDLLGNDEARALLRDGALRLDWAGHRPDRARLVLTAIGAYQLTQALRASARLAAREIEHSVVVMLEPGRFRTPRDARERAHAAPPAVVDRLYPSQVAARVFLVHTRPEPLLGALAPLTTSATAGLGFVNQGGTLSIEGLLFVNRASWAHCVEQAARLLDLPRSAVLDEAEEAALDGHRTPEGVIVTPPAR